MGAEELHDQVRPGKPALGEGERDRALALAVRLSENPFSFCLRYEAPWRYVRREHRGAVAYLERDRVALVWGDPLAAPEEGEALLGEVTATLRGRGLRVCLVLVQEATATQALADGYSVLKIGEQPFFTLADWRRPRGDRGKHLRWCLNRAARAGVRARPYEPADEPLAADVLLAWERRLGQARHARSCARRR